MSFMPHSNILFPTGIERINTLTGTATPAAGSAAVTISSLDIQENDVVVLAFGHGRTADQNLSASGDVSGAYSEQADLFTNSTNDVNLGVYVQKQGATPDATITVGGLAAPDICYHVILYRGVDTVTQIDVATVAAPGGSGTDTANPSAIEPVTLGARIVAVYCGGQSVSTAYTAPSNMNNFLQTATSTVNRVATADKVWTTGAFDPDPVGGGQGTVAGLTWAAATLALRPA